MSPTGPRQPDAGAGQIRGGQTFYFGHASDFWSRIDPWVVRGSGQWTGWQSPDGVGPPAGFPGPEWWWNYVVYAIPWLHWVSGDWAARIITHGGAGSQRYVVVHTMPYPITYPTPTYRQVAAFYPREFKVTK
jgi:hypothetical protein